MQQNTKIISSTNNESFQNNYINDNSLSKITLYKDTNKQNVFINNKELNDKFNNSKIQTNLSINDLNKEFEKKWKI
jgi:hypothetical protein